MNNQFKDTRVFIGISTGVLLTRYSSIMKYFHPAIQNITRVYRY